MKKKILLCISILILVLIIIFLIEKYTKRIVEVSNNNLFADKVITDEMLENSIAFKVDNIIKNDNDVKVLAMLKNNKIVETRFVDDITNIEFSDIVEIGDELFVDGYIENDILYITEIYILNSIKERQGI